MMDAIVQLLRNGLCCVKDLDLFRNTFLYDHTLTAMYYDAPPPMDQTTPLEVAISICQFYAFVSTTLAGFRLVSKSWGTLRRLNTLMRLRGKITRPKASVADVIVDESIANEYASTKKSLLVGVCLIFIGVPFFWLFANSWHVTERDWIGGPLGLIYALISMEVALLPLLSHMKTDGDALINKSTRMKNVAKELKKSDGKLKLGTLNEEMYSWVAPDGFQPYWKSNTFAIERLDDKAEEKLLASEIDAIQRFVSKMKESEDAKVTLTEAAARLESEAPVVRMEGQREYVYLVINFIAFYGYLLGIVAYYHDEEQNQATYLRRLKLGLSNADADWHGNFAGDFMWTVEPVLILSSPMLFSWVKPTSQKIKQN